MTICTATAVKTMSSDSRHSIVASPVTAAIPLLVWCHRAAWRTIFFILVASGDSSTSAVTNMILYIMSGWSGVLADASCRCLHGRLRASAAPPRPPEPSPFHVLDLGLSRERVSSLNWLCAFRAPLRRSSRPVCASQGRCRRSTRWVSARSRPHHIRPFLSSHFRFARRAPLLSFPCRSSPLPLPLMLRIHARPCAGDAVFQHGKR